MFRKQVTMGRSDSKGKREKGKNTIKYQAKNFIKLTEEKNI